MVLKKWICLAAYINLVVLTTAEGLLSCMPKKEDGLCEDLKNLELCFLDYDYGEKFRPCYDACQNTEVNSIYYEDCLRKCPTYAVKYCTDTVKNEFIDDNPLVSVYTEDKGFTEAVKDHSAAFDEPQDNKEISRTIHSQVAIVLYVCVPLGVLATACIRLYVHFILRKGKKVVDQKEKRLEQGETEPLAAEQKGIEEKELVTAQQPAEHLDDPKCQTRSGLMRMHSV